MSGQTKTLGILARLRGFLFFGFWSGRRRFVERLSIRLIVGEFFSGLGRREEASAGSSFEGAAAFSCSGIFCGAAEGRKVTVAQQLAALAPAPNYSFEAKAKAAPIGGGTEKASYESLIYGLILRHRKIPAQSRASHLVHAGAIGIYIDELGNLTHQVIYRTSGDPPLDDANLAAVRRAAPFPPPPHGFPHSFTMTYNNTE